MNALEQRFMETVSWSMRAIVDQLKIMNELKALELKGRQDLNLTPEMVDSALKNEN
jgi:hypothetical protein